MTRSPKKKKEAYQDTNAEQDEQKLPVEINGGEPTRSRPIFRPRVDILETQVGLVLTADMPGATEECVEITLEKRQLTIRADVEDHAPEGMSALYLEYNVGDWERSFTLSREFDMEKIKAVLKNGVLTVTLPKAPEMEAKRIQVNAG